MRFVLVVAALAACHRAPAPTQPANKAPAPDYAAAAADELAFVPLDSDFVVGLSFVELRKSRMWQTFKPQLQAVMRQLNSSGTCADIDFTQVMERATFGMKQRERNQFSAVLVVRGGEMQRGFECSVSETKRSGGTVTVDRGVTVMSRPDLPGMSAATMIVGGSTMVMQFDPAANHDSLIALLAAGSPLRGSSPFMTMFARREPGAAMWGMANGTAPLFDQMASSGMRPRNIDGTIVVTDLLGATVRMTMASPAEANAIANEIGKMKGMAGNYATRFDVAVQGSVAEIRVDLTETQIRGMAGMLGGFGP